MWLTVVAAAVFGASIVGLVDTPHRYGQNWNSELDLGFGAAPARLAARIMATQRQLAGYAGGDYGTVKVGGVTVPAIGIDPLRGQGFVTLLAGRPPRRPDEIVLGARTLRAVHAKLGQRIRVVVNQVTARPATAERGARCVS